MDQDKIGKFIQMLRKEKNISQVELAKRIGVSNKAVSKWETGNGLPDYAVFDGLCRELNITLNELLNGERNVNESSVVSEYMEYKEMQNKKKILWVLIISFLLILCIMLGTYFINSYNKINIYKLSGSSNGFNYSGGVLVLSNINNVFDKGKLSITDDNKRDIVILDRIFAVKEDNKYYKLFSWEYDQLDVEKYGSDDLFPSDKIENIPKNMYLLVYYMKDDDTYLEEIKLNYKKVLGNNKFLNFKSDKSDSGFSYEEISLMSLYNPFDYKKQLQEKGFSTKQDDKNELYTMLVNNCDENYCLYNTITENKVIAIDYINKLFYYYFKDNKYTIDVVAYSYDDNKIDNIPRFYVYYDDGKNINYCRALIHNNGEVSCKCLDEENVKKYGQRIYELFLQYKYKDE